MQISLKVYPQRGLWLLLSLLSNVLGCLDSPVRAQRSGRVHVAIAPTTDSSAPSNTTPKRVSTQPEPASPAGPPMPDSISVTAPDSLQQRAPQFPGGEAALMTFVRERLRYPALAARNRVQGKIIVSFWVDERGHPYGFGVLRGLGAGLDEEALRILREMPDWAPALIDGRAALMQLRIPVTFRLAD